MPCWLARSHSPRHGGAHGHRGSRCACARRSGPPAADRPVTTANITAKALSVTADPQSKIYGSANPALLTATITGFVNSENLASSGVTGTAGVTTTATAGSPVGSYTLTAAIGTLAASNYNFTFVNGSLTVNKRAATWTTTASSKTYGDADPSPLTTGSGNFLVADGVSATYARAAGETVAGSPYHITATLSSTVANALDNYTITNAGANFTIDKRAVEITADAKSKTYGDADPALNYTITSGTLAFTDAFTGALSRVTGEKSRRSSTRW